MVRRLTYSQGSEAGPSLFDLLDGPEIGLSGPEVVPANRIARLAKAKATPTSEISGPKCTASSASVALPSSSESKSPEPQSPGEKLKRVRICKKCKIEKPYSEFYVNSKGNRGRCKECFRKASLMQKRSDPAKTSANFKAWRDENRGRALVNVAKHRAKKRGMAFDLDPEDIQKRIEAGACELSGIPFGLSEPRAWNAPSLDRIDSTLGYTTRNVRVVLYALNVAANIWGPAKILEIASAISTKRRNASQELSNKIAVNLKKQLDTDGSMEYALTWKEKVTPSGFMYSQLVASARQTSDNEPSGWPTPVANDDNKTPELSGWPTPDMSNRGADTHPGSKRDSGAYRALTLQRASSFAGWPTPTSLSFADSHEPGNNRSMNKTVELAGWGTPRSAEAGHTCGNPARAMDRRGRLEDQVYLGTTSESSPAKTASRGVLDAAFSRWLMGFPSSFDRCSPGWADWELMQARLREWHAWLAETERGD